MKKKIKKLNLGDARYYILRVCMVTRPLNRLPLVNVNMDFKTRNLSSPRYAIMQSGWVGSHSKQEQFGYQRKGG